MDLIPGLHDHAAWQSIMRVPYDEFLKASNVSKKWKTEIEHPDFHKMRRAIGVTQPAIVALQSVEDLEDENFRPKGYNPPLPYNLAILNLKTGRWSNLPSVPGFEDGMPPSCRFAGVGTELVVIGGTELKNSHNILDTVFIYNFITGEWRCGAPMPVKRLHFGCTSDSNRMVFVVGGEDIDQNPTKTLMMYDLEQDKWKGLPDMSKEHYLCHVWFNEWKLHVMNDECLSTSLDNLAKREVEIFDIRKLVWGPVSSEYTNICRGIYVDGCDGFVYKCDEEKVMAKKGIVWKTVFKFPKPMSSLYFASMWQSKVILVGIMEYLVSEECYTFDGEYEHTERKQVIETYALDLNNNSWQRLEALPESVQALTYSCFLEI